MPRHIPCTVIVHYVDGVRNSTVVHGLSEAITEAEKLLVGQGEPGITDIFSVDVVRLDTGDSIHHVLGVVNN